MKETNVQTWQRRDDMISTELNGELILLNIDTGKYHAVTGSAYAIWELLADAVTIDALVGSLVERFDVGADACRASVERYLGDLQAAGLVDQTS